MVFYGCQTAASRNTLDSKPYGQYHNCLFLRVCQRFHIVSETFVKRKATFKGPIHLDYPHFHYSQSSCRFQPSHSLQGHIPSFYSITSRASRSANTALNALHPHTKKKKKKKTLEKAILTLDACSLTPYCFAVKSRIILHFIMLTSRLCQ